MQKHLMHLARPPKELWFGVHGAHIWWRWRRHYHRRRPPPLAYYSCTFDDDEAPVVAAFSPFTLCTCTFIHLEQLITIQRYIDHDHKIPYFINQTIFPQFPATLKRDHFLSPPHRFRSWSSITTHYQHDLHSISCSFRDRLKSIDLVPLSTQRSSQLLTINSWFN